VRLFDPFPRTNYRRGAFADRTAPPRSQSQQAPIGGWNERDALDDMPPEDAVILDNWFPGFGKVTVRKGFAEFADTGASGAVETLATLQVGTVNRFYAAADGSIFNVSAGGGSPPTLGSGFTNDRWQWAVMDSKIAFVNGLDAPQTDDGTTFGALTVSGTTVTELVGVNVFKSRSFFWKVDSASFWYSNTDTLGGTLAEFPLGNLGGVGGNLTSMVTWTVDSGAGADDLAVFVMSTGQTIVYAGNDPGDPANWALVGIYNLGAPIGIRAVEKVAGDAVITTVDGYVQLSSALNLGRTSSRDDISNKIINAVLKQTAATGNQFGWQTTHYPAGRRIMFNYPTGEANGFAQHVVNLETGAWCRFKEMNGASWGLFNDKLYFGGAAGKVFLSDTGTSDDGVNILTDARQAYNDLRMPGIRKQVNLVHLLMESTGSLPVNVSLDVDYGVQTTSGEVIEIGVGSEGTPCNTGLWNTFLWVLARA